MTIYTAVMLTLIHAAFLGALASKDVEPRVGRGIGITAVLLAPAVIWAWLQVFT